MDSNDDAPLVPASPSDAQYRSLWFAPRVCSTVLFDDIRDVVLGILTDNNESRESVLDSPPALLLKKQPSLLPASQRDAFLSQMLFLRTDPPVFWRQADGIDKNALFRHFCTSLLFAASLINKAESPEAVLEFSRDMIDVLEALCKPSEQVKAGETTLIAVLAAGREKTGRKSREKLIEAILHSDEYFIPLLSFFCTSSTDSLKPFDDNVVVNVEVISCCCFNASSIIF
jgi:hypothetical protein